MSTTIHMPDLFSPIPKENDDEKQPMPVLESESITTTSAPAEAEVEEASGGKKNKEKKNKEKKEKKPKVPRLTKKQKEAAAAVAAAAAAGAVATLGQPTTIDTASNAAAEPKKKAKKGKKNKRESVGTTDEQEEDAKMAITDNDATASEGEGKATKADKLKKRAAADETKDEEEEEEKEERDSDKPSKPKKVKKVKECCVVGCTAKPTHGLPGTSVSYCASHKEPGTVAKSSKNSCRMMQGKKKCKNAPTFALVAPADYCAEHKQAGDVDLVERACTTCKMLDVVGGPQNQCAKCYPALNRRLVQAKINDVQNYLRKEGPVNVTVHGFLDTTNLAASGVQRLPDSVFSTPSHNILLFIDTPQIEQLPTIEDMHADMKRLLDLAKTAPAPGTSFKPLVLIRFNPDNFVSKDKNSNKKYNKNKKARYEHLLERLTELTAITPTEDASLLWVFFNDYSDKETRLHGLMTPAAMLGGSAMSSASLSAVGNSAAQSNSNAGAAVSLAASSSSASYTSNTFLVVQPPTMSSIEAAATPTVHFDGAAAVAALAHDAQITTAGGDSNTTPLLFSA